MNKRRVCGNMAWQLLTDILWPLSVLAFAVFGIPAQVVVSGGPPAPFWTLTGFWYACDVLGGLTLLVIVGGIMRLFLRRRHGGAGTPTVARLHVIHFLCQMVVVVAAWWAVVAFIIICLMLLPFTVELLAQSWTLTIIWLVIPFLVLGFIAGGIDHLVVRSLARLEMHPEDLSVAEGIVRELVRYLDEHPDVTVAELRGRLTDWNESDRRRIRLWLQGGHKNVLVAARQQQQMLLALNAGLPDWYIMVLRFFIGVELIGYTLILFDSLHHHYQWGFFSAYSVLGGLLALIHFLSKRFVASQDITPERSEWQEDRLPIDTRIPVVIDIAIGTINAQKHRLSYITVQTWPGARARVKVRYVRGREATSGSLKERRHVLHDGRVQWVWKPDPYDENLGLSIASVTVVYRDHRNIATREFTTMPAE